MKYPDARHRGFTLVEIAIVMAIVALLLGGLLVPLSAQVDAQRSSETVKAMGEIREALIGFALANGRLPCPADPTGAAGTERDCAVAANINGVVPWTTLGVPETDAWGRRYTYRVTQCFSDVPISTPGVAPCADPAAGAQSTFALGDNGNITVTDGATTIASSVPAIVISHGKNGLGAYTSSGTQIAGAAGDELGNADANATFVSHTFTATFDDQVTWISTNILMNRMVAAQKLP